jgi:hypothetical protein
MSKETNALYAPRGFTPRDLKQLSIPSFWQMYAVSSRSAKSRQRDNERKRALRAAKPEKYRQHTRDAVRRHRARKTGSASA